MLFVALNLCWVFAAWTERSRYLGCWHLRYLQQEMTIDVVLPKRHPEVT